jgi:hypothetical protein
LGYGDGCKFSFFEMGGNVLAFYLAVVRERFKRNFLPSNVSTGNITHNRHITCCPRATG